MKTRYHSLVTYATEESLRKVLTAKSEQIEFAAYALHDKDIDEYGKAKEPHTHVCLELKEKRELEDVTKWFKACIDTKGEVCNTRNKETHDTKAAYEYLTHSGDSESETGKYQYEDEIIKVLMGDVEAYINSETDEQIRREKAKEKKEATEARADDIEAELNDIIEGKPMRYMARQYGRDYIKNRRAYHEYASAMVLEETGDLEKSCKILGVGFRETLLDEYAKGQNDGIKTAFVAVRDMLRADVDAGAKYEENLLKRIITMIERM